MTASKICLRRYRSGAIPADIYFFDIDTRKTYNSIPLIYPHTRMAKVQNQTRFVVWYKGESAVGMGMVFRGAP